MTLRLGAKRIGDGELVPCSFPEEADESLMLRHPEPPPGVTGESLSEVAVVRSLERAFYYEWTRTGELTHVFQKVSLLYSFSYEFPFLLVN